MKVKVSYTVEINDIPGIINDIIAKCQQNLFNESKNLKCYTGDLNKLHNEITSARETLDLLDVQLEDVINIAAGLENVRNAPPVLEPTEGGEDLDKNES